MSNMITHTSSFDDDMNHIFEVISAYGYQERKIFETHDVKEKLKNINESHITAAYTLDVIHLFTNKWKPKE